MSRLTDIAAAAPHPDADEVTSVVMMGFVFRLLPPRPTFPADMTTAERVTMGEHVEYWRAHAEQGTVLAFGPVADPAGTYGIGIVLAEDLLVAQALRDGDPASLSPHGFRTEIAPMPRLVTPWDLHSYIPPPAASDTPDSVWER